jgi:hypothetical protein
MLSFFTPSFFLSLSLPKKKERKRRKKTPKKEIQTPKRNRQKI